MKKNIVLTCLISIVTFSLILSNSAYSTSGCDEDCAKCHKLSNTEASDILKSLKITDAKIQNIQISPLKGLWEILLEKEEKKGIIYVDFSKKYVLGGPIIEIKTATDKTAERLPPPPTNIIPQSKISLKDAIVLGNKNASKKVIVFTDTD